MTSSMIPYLTLADIPGVQGVQRTPGIEEKKLKNRIAGIR